MISERQVVLVQHSWAAVEPISGRAAALFYGRLFELAPDVRLLFTGDLVEQGRKLMQMLGVVVAGLDGLERIVPAVQALGRRHLAYGVRETDYDAVGAALLWTLGQGLGEAFTAEVEDAWAGAYALLAETMKAAASEAQAA